MSKPHHGLCGCADCMMWSDFYNPHRRAQRRREKAAEEAYAAAMEEQYERDMCIARIEDAYLEDLTTDQLNKLATLVNRMEAENAHKDDDATD